jgi:hypothetical protein
VTREEAEDYACQWGSLVTSCDPGAAMYGDFRDAKTRELAADFVRTDCLEIARRGQCCGSDGAPCLDDVERLCELLAYLER